MALETYRAKRDFSRTREPSGVKGRKATGLYLIQKHDATRLHYDLRLELDGVLLSWAVTRGPSLVPGEKRLAVHVEDHPVAYGDFEGTIPKGEYGGGTVMLWDRGTWAPIGDAKKGLAKGHLEFELKGEKLTGRWHLVRLRARPREKRDNWLLIKGEDDAARTEADPDILEDEPNSVKTGRTIPEIAQEAPGWSSKTGPIPKAKRRAGEEAKANGARKAKAKAQAAKAQDEAAPDAVAAPDPAAIRGAKAGRLPGFVEPALAKLVAKPPAGKGWLHEIKFDGYRLQARISQGKLRLLTRSGLDWTERFGARVHDALLALPVKSALIDGELVVEGPNGASDFSALQADLSEGRSDRFVFYAFDLMFLNGQDLTGAKLCDRKAALQTLLEGADHILRFSGDFGDDGALILSHACRLSLEGIVSKRADAPYRSGRTGDFVKAKCSERQEFVIGGYVPSSTGAAAIGSLVLGYGEKGKLRHAGRVGTGFSQTVARDLMKRLKPMRVKDSPFADALTAEEARDVTFVAPELVAEVEFRAWTADDHIRHASFRGLREDKTAADVKRETPEARMPQAKVGTEKTAKAGKTAAPKSGVKLTHPDRLYWPDAGVTKAGLADYYAQVWRWMGPFVTGRPLALLRCPEGTAGQCFFQKHVWRGASKSIRLVTDPQDKDAGPLVAVDDLDGLAGLVQAGVLEIHPWGSTLRDMEHPDQIILDLDPGEGVDWADITAAAREVKARLEAVGLASFVKTSGGKGLHVVAPLKPKADWAAAKTFAHDLAFAMAKDDPDAFVAVVTKAKRKGRILVDYLRNGRGNTAVAAYSTRARAGAPVSMPVAWAEIDDIGPAAFAVENAPTRLLNLKADPWADFWDSAAPLPAAKGRRKG
ncbi:ATP-dependent DNA ligase [Azorhizobium oxalatiphilum]|uniref:DNA ligase (ATP) n=1 Tax=Azorhizobium oxalatiphilum TaxID=980631 RepID=A0A917C958_9HYPH|nr:DNA ligase D [Azorhizobium oxalatiphilum]GGF78417.1 ATP-dependent DNA ligase [Azorhizobium oxalatiphilum]